MEKWRYPLMIAFASLSSIGAIQDKQERIDALIGIGLTVALSAGLYFWLNRKKKQR